MASGQVGSQDEAVRIVRVIARLNVGGPSIQAISLTKGLEEYGYRTSLVRGVEGPDEGNMDYLAAELEVLPIRIRWMRRNPSWRDLPALIALVRVLRRERPHILHTHAAKGGTLGRVAALIAFPLRRTRPIVIHTYHGHSLTGYFSPRTARVYRFIETCLAWFSDRLIAVSSEVRDELVRLGVASPGQFVVVPLGFNLVPFTRSGPVRARIRDALREELGIPYDAPVVTLIARLVPIKRVDRFLRLARALCDLGDVRFVIVGDGELRDSLQSGSDAHALNGRVIWTGFRRDVAELCIASDVVVQTSDNEGTPVTLIEAQAAGAPVVSTRVGGAASVVADERLLADPDDEEALARAVRRLLTDRELADQLAQAGHERVLTQFTLERLLSDIDGVYRGLLDLQLR